uniref:IS200/IS605 family transposase n=2 Tax=Nostoc TaxID=1177 RepID=UPI0036F34096
MKVFAFISNFFMLFTHLLNCFLCACGRRKAFNTAMLERLHTVFEELLIKWDCKLVEFNGEDNHVHLLFQYHPDLELSKLVNNLKSISSIKLRQEFSEHLKLFYSQDVF